MISFTAEKGRHERPAEEKHGAHSIYVMDRG